MKIIKIEPMVEDSAWEVVKRNTFNCRPDSDQHRAWIVFYKLKGNKQHQMNVFAPNELVALARANARLNIIQGESNEFR